MEFEAMNTHSGVSGSSQRNAVFLYPAKLCFAAFPSVFAKKYRILRNFPQKSADTQQNKACKNTQTPAVPDETLSFFHRIPPPQHTPAHLSPPKVPESPTAYPPAYRPLWILRHRPQACPAVRRRIHSARFTRTYSAEIPSRLLTVWRTSNLPHHRTSSDTIVPYFQKEIKSHFDGKRRNFKSRSSSCCAICLPTTRLGAPNEKESKSIAVPSSPPPCIKFFARLFSKKAAFPPAFSLVPSADIP